MSLFNIEEIKKIQNNGKPIDESVEDFCIKACSEFYRTARNLDRLARDMDRPSYSLFTDQSHRGRHVLFRDGESFWESYQIIVNGNRYSDERAGKFLAHLCGYNQRICEIVFESFFKGTPLSMSRVEEMVKSGKYDR
jgi:hypothetical protein